MLCRGGLGGPDVLMQDRGSADADATVDGPDSGPVAVIGQQDSKQQSRFVAVLFCICTKQQQRALHMDTENRESLSFSSQWQIKLAKICATHGESTTLFSQEQVYWGVTNSNSYSIILMMLWPQGPVFLC